jgi:two-component sensor histidine kinase
MSLGALAVRHDPASAGLVRRSIADDLSARSVTPASIDDVVLVANELVGNAVVHTSVRPDGALAVDWQLEGETVVISVGDGSPQLPQVRPTTEAETGGRGLTIVAALAAEWGVRRTDEGKQVWARVPVVRG